LSYPRLSNISRGSFKNLLNANIVFESLTDSQKNEIVEAAVQLNADLENSLNKEDYQADTMIGGEAIGTIGLISPSGLWADRPMDVPIGTHYFVLKDTDGGDRDYVFDGEEYV
jgi:hypothetical protein